MYTRTDQIIYYSGDLGWYAEFLLKIVLQFLLGKIAARLIFKIMLGSLHIGPEVRTCLDFEWSQRGWFTNGPGFE